MKKKIFAGMLFASMMLGGTAYAAEQDLGVVLLNPVEEENTNENVTLDDLQIGDVAEIEGFGDLTVTSFEFEDSFRYLPDPWNVKRKESGSETDYAVLKVKVLNTNTSAKRYLNDLSVKMIYDDKYEYQGWVFQYYINDSNTDIAMEEEVVEREEEGDIEPMYVGYYMLGCTVPNAVVEGKAPLRMEINFGGNEITYNVRK